jgi:hypothetical protein
MLDYRIELRGVVSLTDRSSCVWEGDAWNEEAEVGTDGHDGLHPSATCHVQLSGRETALAHGPERCIAGPPRPNTAQKIRYDP